MLPFCFHLLPLASAACPVSRQEPAKRLLSSRPRQLIARTIGCRATSRPSRSKGYGNCIRILHSGGYRTRCAHLATIGIVDGYVHGGQQVGTVGMTGGATGPHLHSERRLYGASVLQNFVEGAARPGSVLTSGN